MGQAPATRPSLLVRLRDPRDGPAWEEFVELYAPLVYGFARKHGLQDADAADLTQDVLRAIPPAVARLAYDPARGSFRGWLFTVVRNKLRDYWEAKSRHVQGTGDSSVQALLGELPARGEDPAADWDREYERRLFAWAADRVRRDVQPATWRAFWRTAVDGTAGRDVAAELGMTVAAVYLAKSRVMARLKEEIQQLGDE